MEAPIITPEQASEMAAKGGVTRVAAQDIEKVFTSNYIDLISKPLGSQILGVSDEWFAEAANLTTRTAPIRRPGVFTYAGAWYDGWETRRHNSAPFDWVVVRTGVASGRVAGVEIDTAFFNGNQAPEIAVEGCFSADDAPVVAAAGAPQTEGVWETILERQECGPSQRHAWLLPRLSEKAYTHVRLLMFPDGGIARFRLYGSAVPVWPADPREQLDLAATVNGGVAVSCSDQHFGTKDNLLLPGRGVDMGDGWETTRSRGKDHVDWVIVRLGDEGFVDRVVVDTAHFRGNYPQAVRVHGIKVAKGKEPRADDKAWVEVLEAQKCSPDKEHEYGAETLKAVADQSFTHMKLTMIPDGGIKRFRVFGRRVA